MSKLRVGLLMHRRRRPGPAAAAMAEVLGEALKDLEKQSMPKPHTVRRRISA
jgi:hypothetical protein